MVSFTLLENALDSVEIGLEYFRKSRESQNRRDYKQCLLNLFQAAELLLKAAVSRQDAGRIFTQKSLKSIVRILHVPQKVSCTDASL
ncbi:hypothetical protein LE081_23150 [Escherichia coli]|nr:hypothetical protein [Escherichia coli]